MTLAVTFILLLVGAYFASIWFCRTHDLLFMYYEELRKQSLWFKTKWLLFGIASVTFFLSICFIAAFFLAMLIPGVVEWSGS